MEIIDFGISSYRTIWEKQKSFQEKLVGLKKNKYPINDEVVMMGEHSPVYTLGFHGDAANLLIDENSLKSKGCECIRIERGGDITFHGHGQLILYPIIDLEKRGLGVKKYINILSFTSFISISNPISFRMDVTPLSINPHGLMAENQDRSVLTFNARPCIVIDRDIFTPIAHIFLA